ncbi:MAG: C4-dicarboxylate transporter DcuC [Phascolarctobacterium sp.]|uniref:C4-dicarboxylate transporter DcuC n=1 Tax=Phascolarctobacterium sp. TaxID=2049039 RepID=UPI0026DC11EE|nr:C4-dicarboxylate transporter DcuC [Phascolarctobacterium sp.]MDO4922393.1 C4-dicarboxylate transporter DcuC [Phascolarctobacterium sp.]
MNSLLLIGLTVIFSLIVARLILKKYNAIFVFFASGIVIMLAANALTGTPILGKTTMGSPLLDVFGFLSQSFKTNIANIGMIIMMVTGYAAYMKHIQASTKLAYLASNPLSKIRNKYLVLSGMYLVGMALKLVITSQAGLSVLLLATVFPVLMAIGISPITSASVLSLICIDYGPNDGSTIFMSGVLQMNVVDLFLKHQLAVAGSIIAVMAVLIPFYYKYMDNRDKSRGTYQAQEITKLDNPDVPTYYALLPVIPLAIVFADYFIPSTKIDVITANIMGMFITFVIEFCRRSDRSEIPKDVVVILRAMADIFVSVVAIIISASCFAQGIKMLGGISIFAHYAAGMEGAVFIIMLVLALITFLFAVIMGSGAAPLFAFGSLTPEIASKLGVPAVTLILPMEIASALGRATSPVCGAVIAVAGVAGIEPIQLVKRSAPMLVLAFIVNCVASYIFNI